MAVLVVERDKVVKNINLLSQLFSGSQIIGVVKGNGYGLGLLAFAKLLQECGVYMFAVSRVEEAILLRQNGFTQEILNMTPVVSREDAAALISNNIIATIGSYENAVLLNGVAEEVGRICKAHIKIDTGFGRFGFFPAETEKVKSIVEFLRFVEIEGIFTHLHSAFGKEETVKAQYDKFIGVCDELRAQGVALPIRHMANSCGALQFDFTRLDAVRIGSAFLGRLPIKNKWGLSKVGYLKAKVVDIKWMPKGSNIGYGQGYATKDACRVGVVDVGYIDGFDMGKSKDVFRLRDVMRYVLHDLKGLFGNRRPWVTIGGKKIQVIGRVAMCHTMVDVTKTEVQTGDAVHIECNPLFVPESVERQYV